jgi:hypothetical protein
MDMRGRSAGRGGKSEEAADLEMNPKKLPNLGFDVRLTRYLF